ncbi:MAG TPA: hypothetical protein VNL77_08065 [Roseiflexaceae bacterium]|nr:hypothetical protein [Roseiflexaceae bacterium]
MRRILALLLIVSLFLAACGGGGDTTVPPPPASRPFESSGSEQVDALVAEWRTVAWEQMVADGVKPETKEERVYLSTASLAEIDRFYGELTAKGWYRLARMPGVKDDVLLNGYEHGATSLVVGAVDASKYGGQGVVIYTLKGTK